MSMHRSFHMGAAGRGGLAFYTLLVDWMCGTKETRELPSPAPLLRVRLVHRQRPFEGRPLRWLLPHLR